MQEPPKVQPLIDAIFLPQNLDDAGVLKDSCTAFINLAGFFAHGEGLDPRLLVIDRCGLVQMLKRFQRDAHGVLAFHNKLNNLSDQDITSQTKARILADLKLVGIRINSTNPRKTRIAAVFSLWMAVFRPVFLRMDARSDAEAYKSFTAHLNLYIASRYLRKYGYIEWGNNAHDASIRRQHIWYDFTYRALNLSTLELMYCVLFRPATKSVR